MKIFHGFKSWNFQLESLAKSEKLLGLDSDFYNYSDILKNPFLILKIIKDYDIFNFYTNYTFLPIPVKSQLPFILFGGLDLYILKKLGKKIILHYQGCDIKNRFNDPTPNVCKYCAFTEQTCTKKKSAQRVNKIKNLLLLADEVCVTTPDLYEYIDYKKHKVNWIPKVNFRDVASDGRKYGVFNAENKMKIVHAPSKRSKKGTEVIIDVVEKNKDKFELILIENKTRDEVIKIANNADLAIDQLRIGWYGNYAVEMMSLGLPTIAYISDEALKYVDNNCKLPIINTPADKLENMLLELYHNPSMLEASSINSIEFVKAFHSPENIGNKMLNIYQRTSRKEV